MTNFQKGFIVAPIIIWAVIGLFAVAAANKTGLIQFNLSGEGGLLQVSNNPATKQEQSPDPFTSSDLIDTVQQFYSNIGSKNFNGAWNLLSKNFQDYAQGYDNFVGGYKTTLNTLVKDIRVQDLSDNKVYVLLEASNNVNGQVQTKTFEGTWKLVLENGQWKLDSADIALESVSPISKPTQPPVPKPTNTLIPTPSPTSNPNAGKEAALKLIDEKIRNIDQVISSLQSAIDGTLRNEQKQCNKTRPPSTTEEGLLLDPFLDELRDYQCSMGYFNVVAGMRQKIDLLLKERNEYVRQKAQIMAQP